MTSSWRSCFLLALLVCVFTSAQGQSGGNNNELNNRCLKLLSSSRQAAFNSVLGKCLNAARAQSGRVPKHLLVRLTSRCVGRGLNYLQPDGSVNKPVLLAAVESNRAITQAERDRFKKRINECDNFDACVARDCQ